MATGLAQEVAESLPDAKGQQYLTTFMAALDGTAMSFCPLPNRWGRERDITVSKTSGVMDTVAFNHFAAYLAEHD
ncbi:hypothetical protein AD953_05030 [Acetobacter malorum]|uniref:Uncharacterized protein n=1 Tax=Acetobacter malorum TaxID=178901 RepID=A0A149V9X9_9PROT|nr:hypothetical protein [Acetobacter malorum]KXV76942.1 hypothetical protein AD953_05030 [Acetobacter malorum]